MRVITGTAGGRRLNTPDGMDVRPTVSKVKEGIFSALQFDIEGRRILDLFAGSGQLGIECISRGAASAVLVDNAARSLECIKSNVSSCGFEDKCTIINKDSISYISTCRDTFDIAFLDPPYKMGLTQKAMPFVCERMSDFGMIVCEHARDEILPESFGEFILKKEYKYGTVKVSVYKKDR